MITSRLVRRVTTMMRGESQTRKCRGWWTPCERVSVRIVRVLCRDQWLTNRNAMAGGAPTKVVLPYLKEASGEVIPKDVQNMTTEIRTNVYTSPDVSKRVQEVLHDFCSMPDNMATPSVVTAAKRAASPFRRSSCKRWSEGSQRAASKRHLRDQLEQVCRIRFVRGGVEFVRI